MKSSTPKRISIALIKPTRTQIALKSQMPRKLRESTPTAAAAIFNQLPFRDSESADSVITARVRSRGRAHACQHAGLARPELVVGELAPLVQLCKALELVCLARRPS